MLRQILEECKQGFGEVIVMVSNTAASAEVFTSLDDLRVDDNVLTILPEETTHVHLYLDQIKKVRFIFKTSSKRLPTYTVWFLDKNDDPAFRLYLRETEETRGNKQRHDWFMKLKQKYGDLVDLEGDAARE